MKTIALFTSLFLLSGAAYAQSDSDRLSVAGFYSSNHSFLTGMFGNRSSFASVNREKKKYKHSSRDRGRQGIKRSKFNDEAYLRSISFSD